ncbi:MAG: hypothetical protein MSD82_03875 [Prevotella sp.]|nr:hypothetical protein [Prevotella sp.]
MMKDEIRPQDGKLEPSRPLYVFNPEHDIALAANRERFTPPRAGLQLRHDLGFLPALWAQADAVVMVEDEVAAKRSWDRFRDCRGISSSVRFVTPATLRTLIRADRLVEIRPWGWDSALRRQLLDAGVLSHLVPTDHDLAEIREVSNRRWAAENLLPEMVSMDPVMIGEAHYCTSLQAVREVLGDHGKRLCKSPWSSTGRGLRLLDDAGWPPQTEGWIARVIGQQGGVMLEPYYDKLQDFAMEFRATAAGVVYEGLSVFSTAHGAYEGSLLASEKEKASLLSDSLPSSLLDRIRRRMADLLNGRLPKSYRGPLGIDMMIVADRKDRRSVRVHPCVELNLRMTMGHAALAMHRLMPEFRGHMRIAYDGSYCIELESR